MTEEPCICGGNSPFTEDRHAITCPSHAYHEAWLDMAATPALLPCPFCGSPTPSMKRPDAVWCGSCLAEMPEHDPEVPNAVARWNTRLSHSAEKEALIEALEKIAGKVPRAQQHDGLPAHRCGHCGYVWFDGKPERHGPGCAYEIARSTLSKIKGHPDNAERPGSEIASIHNHREKGGAGPQDTTMRNNGNG